MSYGVLPFNEFPGIDLNSPPDQSGCLDALNVDTETQGAVKHRAGYDNFTTSAAANRYNALGVFNSPSFSQILAGRSNGDVDAIDGAGAVVATAAGGAGALNYTFARFGAPTTQYLYMAASQSATVRRWDGAAFALVGGSPTGSLITVQPADNRLVVGNLSTGVSRVQFSAAGDPTTWGANDYVDLAPGDYGLTALVAWREMLFAFKRDKFFVFYGNSTSATGTTVFNYRPVDTGIGCVFSRAVAVAPEGVYFVGDDGIYLTSGGLPSRVSGPLDPLWAGTLPSFFTASALVAPTIRTMTLTYHRRKLYMAYAQTGSSAHDRMLVYDIERRAWMVWNVPAAAIVPWNRVGTTDLTDLFFSYASGANHLGRMSSAFSDDDGATIASHFRSGFVDMGHTNEKVVKETELWGYGTVAVSLSKDFGALDTAANVALGSNPTIARGVHQVSKKGTLFSFKLASVSGGRWAVHRVAHNIQGERPPGQRS